MIIQPFAPVGNDDPLSAFGRPARISLPSAQATRALDSGYFGHVVVSSEEANVLRIILKIFVFYLFSCFFFFYSKTTNS